MYDVRVPTFMLFTHVRTNNLIKYHIKHICKCDAKWKKILLIKPFTTRLDDDEYVSFRVLCNDIQ